MLSEFVPKGAQERKKEACLASLLFSAWGTNPQLSPLPPTDLKQPCVSSLRSSPSWWFCCPSVRAGLRVGRGRERERERDQRMHPHEHCLRTHAFPCFTKKKHASQPSSPLRRRSGGGGAGARGGAAAGAVAGAGTEVRCPLKGRRWTRRWGGEASVRLCLGITRPAASPRRPAAANCPHIGRKRAFAKHLAGVACPPSPVGRAPGRPRSSQVPAAALERHLHRSCRHDKRRGGGQATTSLLASLTHTSPLPHTQHRLGLERRLRRRLLRWVRPQAPRPAPGRVSAARRGGVVPARCLSSRLGRRPIDFS